MFLDINGRGVVAWSGVGRCHISRTNHGDETVSGSVEEGIIVMGFRFLAGTGIQRRFEREVRFYGEIIQHADSMGTFSRFIRWPRRRHARDEARSCEGAPNRIDQSGTIE